jgi:hypothetical protein
MVTITRYLISAFEKMPLIYVFKEPLLKRNLIPHGKGRTPFTK